MTLGQLVGRNLLYHWRGNVAVLFGVAVGTAVLTGALLVGDSLRGSLRELTLEQLGWVDHALVTSRFIRQELASGLEVDQSSAAILVRGAASARTALTRGSGTGATVRRAGQVTILAVDARFWYEGRAPAARSATQDPCPGGTDAWESAREGVVLNTALAEELRVAAGDTVTLHLQKVSAIPRETPLSRRDASEIVDELKVTVRAVLPNQGIGRFSLNSSPTLPRNAFVPLRLLQAELHQEGRVNALLVGGGSEGLQESLRAHLTLEDWGLTLHTPESRTQELFDKLDRNRDGRLTANEYRRRVAESFVQAADQNRDGVLDRAEVSAFYHNHRNYLSLESRQLLLEPVVALASLAAAQEAGLRAAPTLVYLANSISDGKQSIPYSIVAALDPGLPPPLGPFLPDGVAALKDDEIVLADWKDSALQVKPGDNITLAYFLPEIEGQIQETTMTLRLRGTIPLQGPATDPDLTPAFPGITDKLDIRDWDPPFPYDNKRIQKRDEIYWEQYRTTPKAYVTLSKGRQLWGSRFGQYTSIRLAPLVANHTSHSQDLTKLAEDFSRRLLAHLSPEKGGLVFDDVRRRGLEGSVSSTDFGWLFVGFSCFLIAAVLLLVGLLFRLNLDRRATEIGLLMATGYSRGTLRRLWLAEGSLLAILGGFMGTAGALLYTWLLLEFLRAWWPRSVDLSFLHLHATKLSFLIGYSATVVVSLLTISWSVRTLGRVSPRALLAGETAEATLSSPTRRTSPWSLWIGVSSSAGGLVCLVLGNFVSDQELQAMTFFSSGALLLTACLTGVWMWMHGSRHGRVSGHGMPALARLGIRNAARYPLRSLLTAGLLASATFLIVAVESFYRDPGKDFLNVNSGSGGFSLLGECEVPIFQDLNSTKGQDELNFSNDDKSTLQGVTFYSFRLRLGDDASCLNLYQPQRPRLLGVPHDLIRRGGFRFKASQARSAEERANPWQLLEQTLPDGAIPVFGEANTVEWILHKGLGQEMQLPDERGEPVQLRIVGLLQDSVFQSELLLSEAQFLKLYPRQEGYQFFLIDAPERAAEVRAQLETVLANHGFHALPTAQRLESYLAVENTYLSTFQALGGLGLILGALGLAIVLLRSVWERRGELALLRALGFREKALGWLVLAENGFLLILGLGAGTVTALLSVSSHLLSGTGAVPWVRLVVLLIVVLLVGLTAGAIAVTRALHAPLLSALRHE